MKYRLLRVGILAFATVIVACGSPSASAPTSAPASTNAPASTSVPAPTMDMGSTAMAGGMDMGNTAMASGMDMGSTAMAGGMNMGGDMSSGTPMPTVTPGIAANIPAATPDVSAYPVTIQNCGRTLTFTKPPERVVALYPLTAEFLLRLGLKDRIIGAAFTASDPVAPDLRVAFNALPVLTTDAAPNKELLLTARPDFVIDNFPALFYNAAQGFATIDDLTASGVQAYTLTSRCDGNEATGKVEDVYTDVENLGKIFGVADRANQLVAQLQARVAAVQAKIAGQPKPRVLIYDSGVGPINVFGPGAIANVVEQAGGENVFADEKQEFLMLSAEEVAVRDPQVIVILERFGNRMMSMGKDLTAQEAADFLIKTFPNTSAAKGQRVVLVPYQQLYAGLQTIDGVETVAKALYPDLFQ